MQTIYEQPGMSSRIGTGLAEAINQFSQYKMKQLTERSQYKEQQQRGTELWKNLGFPEKQARALGSASQQVQQTAMKEFAPFIGSNIRRDQQGQQQGQQQQRPGIQDLLAPKQGVAQQIPTQTRQPGIQQPPQQQQSQIDQAMEHGTPMDRMARQAIDPEIPKAILAQAYKQEQQKAKPTKANTATPVTPTMEPSMPQYENEPMTRSEAMARKEQIKDMREQQKEAFKAQKEEKKEAKEKQEKIEKENEPFLDEMKKAKNAQKFVKPRILRQEKLIKSGKLPYAATHSLLKFVGDLPAHFGGKSVDISFAEGASATEFEKLSKEYMKFLKDYFGSRILQIDVENFLKTIPALAQTDQGKWRIIQNMKALGDVQEIRSKATDDIIDENDGVQPSRLEKLVDERTKERTDKILDEFINGTYGGNLEYEGGLWGTLKAYGPNEG